MSDKEELAATLSPLTSSTYATAKAVDALWSAGWRKKPDRLALTMFMRAVSPVVHEPLATEAAEKWADAILALLDGPTETGEK